ncbi:MAG: molecular chaperone [Pseudomonadota bacterium]
MTAIGLDYGTSHCSAGIVLNGNARVLPLEDGRSLLPSVLWAPNVRFELDLDPAGRLRTEGARFAALAFGEAALARYLDAPGKGYYVKSPKSFLGAPGLPDEVRERFVRLVAAMLARVRVATEAAMQAPVTAAAIGRPVNFQGPAGSVENESAVAMLKAAATMAGLPEVEFLYEPLAAAFEYEARLNAEQRVLVIDVGGGTTDCSFVRVGPDRAEQSDRQDDVLGHSGERIGGNDYDQALALRLAVPRLGWQAERRRGLPVPNHYFIDAISINDVNAQARFYASATRERLHELAAEVQGTRDLERLISLQENRGSYQLIRQFELAKIALSTSDPVPCALEFLEARLRLDVTRADLRLASERLLEHLHDTVRDALVQGGSKPDVVYLTGGMAQSPVVRAHLERLLGTLPVLDSDHFASVTEGLSLHAARCFTAR